MNKMKESGTIARSWIVGLGLVVLLAAPAAAEDLVTYRLTKGKQFQLCRDLEANLKSLGPQSPGMCELPINPAFERLRAIQWEDLDPLADWDLFVEVLDRRLELPKGERDEPAAIANRDERRQKIIGEAEAGEIGFGRARFDLNNDGTKDIVYRIGRRGCHDIYPKPHRTYLWGYTVLLEDQPTLAQQVGTRIKKLGPTDAFYFEGRAFLANVPAYSGAFYVLETDVTLNSLALRQVCNFEAMASEGGN